jgi:hypothetical protein
MLVLAWHQLQLTVYVWPKKQIKSWLTHSPLKQLSKPSNLFRNFPHPFWWECCLNDVGDATRTRTRPSTFSLTRALNCYALLSAQFNFFVCGKIDLFMIRVHNFRLFSKHHVMQNTPWPRVRILDNACVILVDFNSLKEWSYKDIFIFLRNFLLCLLLSLISGSGDVPMQDAVRRC